jgi:hypothetical protein
MRSTQQNHEPVETKIEGVVIPVSDVDRSEAATRDGARHAGSERR